MQRVNEFEFYRFAARLAPLRKWTEDVAYREVFAEFMDCRTALQEMWKKHPFVVSQGAAQQLINASSKSVTVTMNRLF